MKQNHVQMANAMSDKLESTAGWRALRMFNAFMAYACFLVVLATAGVYGYESLLQKDTMISVNSIVPTKTRFNSGEKVNFYVLADLLHTDKADLHTTLRCDNFVTESNTTITRNDINDTDGKVDIIQFTTAIDRMMDIDPARSISYEGNYPVTRISSCVGEHTITTLTPIFQIPVTIEVQSYPFEYAWIQLPQ